MIGARLRELRQSKGITQNELGSVLGVGKTTISQYESETRKPDSIMLQSIADYFNVTVDFLLGRTDNPNTVILEGDQIPEELRNVDVELIEVIKEAKESGLTPSEIKEILEFARKMKKK
ncbi:MAG: helix-turn-helix domain-containing protein [Caulobacteraceae bacterium]